MIWYSHVNEDTSPERLALRESVARTAVVIAGSGERLIALLEAPQLEHVMVVDSNPDALRLTAAKIEALRSLEVYDYLALLGHRDTSTAQRRAWWRELATTGEMSRLEVGAGLLFVGAFERWLARLRPWVHLWLGKTFTRWVREGLPATLPATFPRRRFALLLRLFSFRFTCTCTGNRDQAFIGRGADPGRLAQVFQKGLRDGTLGANPMAHLAFAGHLRGMNTDVTPFSLQPRVLVDVRRRLASLHIEFVAADVAAFSLHPRLPWVRQREEVFSSLSDLASFLPRAICDRVAARATAARGSVAVQRGFLRNRHAPPAGVRDLSAYERTGMYSVHEYRHDVTTAHVA